MAGKYVLEATGIMKSFSGVTVLNGAELCIEPGELHALMGENGAGKSTLMKIIMGIYTKDAGKVMLDGEEVDFKSARDALDAGISMIHQELSPIPEMTVAENVFLGREQKKIKGLPFVDKKELNRKTQELLEEYNLEQFIRPSMKMKDLNIAQIFQKKRQRHFLRSLTAFEKRTLESFIFLIVWKKYSSWQTVFLSFVTDSS